MTFRHLAFSRSQNGWEGSSVAPFGHEEQMLGFTLGAIKGHSVERGTQNRAYNREVERAWQRSTFGVKIAVLLLSPGLGISGDKVRDWQTGKVLDAETSSYFAGTVGHGHTTGTVETDGEYGTYHSNTNTSQRAIYKVYETFLIEGNTHAYLAQERLHWRWSKPANLTVNGPVKFAVERRKLFVVDDDGKEHEMEIIKRVLRSSPPQQPQRQ